MRPITLIGMPGVGKSTVGVLLAKRLAFRFIDTDLLIQREAGCPLQDIIHRDGYEALRVLEARVLLSVDPTDAVVATGGSAVYGEDAMEHLHSLSHIVHLTAPAAVIKRRLGDYSARGIAMPDGQTFEDLYHERQKLYQHWATATVDVDRPIEEVPPAIVAALASDTD